MLMVKHHNCVGTVAIPRRVRFTYDDRVTLLVGRPARYPLHGGCHPGYGLSIHAERLEMRRAYRKCELQFHDGKRRRNNSAGGRGRVPLSTRRFRRTG